MPIGVRQRQLCVRTFLLGILLCIADDRPAHLTRVHQALLALGNEDRWRLGVYVRDKRGPHLLTIARSSARRDSSLGRSRNHRLTARRQSFCPSSPTRFRGERG